ncbi:MAG: hypothetical protein K2H42_02290 [Alistipes sp.]|nr:hypothetical protein [Alistipes sp.]
MTKSIDVNSAGEPSSRTAWAILNPTRWLPSSMSEPLLSAYPHAKGRFSQSPVVGFCVLLDASRVPRSV